jgi:hypothetical protein
MTDHPRRGDHPVGAAVGSVARTADEDVQTVGLSFTRCPGVPYSGHLARAVASSRRVHTRVARR